MLLILSLAVSNFHLVQSLYLSYQLFYFCYFYSCYLLKFYFCYFLYLTYQIRKFLLSCLILCHLKNFLKHFLNIHFIFLNFGARGLLLLYTVKKICSMKDLIGVVVKDSFKIFVGLKDRNWNASYFHVRDFEFKFFKNNWISIVCKLFYHLHITTFFHLKKIYISQQA